MSCRNCVNAVGPIHPLSRGFANTGEKIFTSVSSPWASYAEGSNGCEEKTPTSASALSNWLMRTLDQFSSQIISIDRGIAERWGQLGVPDPIPAVDGLIAATALERNLIVVTGDHKHFSRIGVRHLNPFEGRD